MCVDARRGLSTRKIRPPSAAAGRGKTSNLSCKPATDMRTLPSPPSAVLPLRDALIEFLSGIPGVISAAKQCWVRIPGEAQSARCFGAQRPYETKDVGLGQTVVGHGNVQRTTSGSRCSMKRLMDAETGTCRAPQGRGPGIVGRPSRRQSRVRRRSGSSGHRVLHARWWRHGSRRPRRAVRGSSGLTSGRCRRWAPTDLNHYPNGLLTLPRAPRVLLWQHHERQAQAIEHGKALSRRTEP